ncbi:MAG: hypothetical protein AB7K08_04500 [Microbacteriaceae bacterium]
MAAVSTSRRSLTGLLLIIAGALLLLAIILPLAGLAVSWLGGLGYLVLAVALIVFAIGGVNAMLTKVLLIVSGVGWALLALGAFGLALPGVLVTIAALVAGIGTVVAAIVLYVGKEIRNTPALFFIITAVLGLLVLLPSFGVAALAGTLYTIIAVAFAVGLIVTGYLFTRKEGR